jgi:hypothetical protein
MVERRRADGKWIAWKPEFLRHEKREDAPILKRSDCSAAGCNELQSWLKEM